LAKLGKDEIVPKEVFMKICNELKCDVGNIMEFVPDKEEKCWLALMRVDQLRKRYEI